MFALHLLTAIQVTADWGGAVFLWGLGLPTNVLKNFLNKIVNSRWFASVIQQKSELNKILAFCTTLSNTFTVKCSLKTS